MHDQLATGRKLRVLTVVDTFSRFSPAIDPRFSYRGEDVVQILDRVCAEVGYPATIRVDQGSEFVSRDLDLWAYMRGRSALAVRSVSRRRRYSAEEMKAILAEASAPGATVSEVSRRHHITRSLIHNWRRQEAASLLGAAVRFTPVTVVAEMPSAAEVSSATPAGNRIEIELPGGVQIRIEGGVEEESLKRVLRALRR